MVLYEIFTVGKFSSQVNVLGAFSITLHNSSSVSFFSFHNFL